MDIVLDQDDQPAGRLIMDMRGLFGVALALNHRPDQRDTDRKAGPCTDLGANPDVVVQQVGQAPDDRQP